ncbi:MAG TPA: hypothetical protein VEL79_16435, partial [Vicinamibacterales bacterium]|nr:hypothetical protein [Vicinamibacterales bacterium]
MTLRTWSCLLALVAMTATGLAQQPTQTQTPPSRGQGQGRGGQGGQRQPQRDRPPTPAGRSAISGRVLTADTSRPVKRARVM